MSKVTLTTIASDYAALAKMNGNFTALRDAIENTLSRDGTAPNQMEAILDMNHFQIKNLADGTDPTDAVNLRQLTGVVGFPGPPGGNVLAVGLYSTLIAGTAIPAGTTLVRTTGYNATGVGGAFYQTDATVTAPMVSANPLWAFTSPDGRRWRLSPDQPINIEMFGADPTFTNDSTNAIKAGRAYLIINKASRGGNTYNTTGSGYVGLGELVVPTGTYKLTQTLDHADGTITYRGQSTGSAGGDASIFRWTADVPGMRFWKAGDTRYLGGAFTGNADGSRIIGLTLEGVNDRFNTKTDLATDNDGVFASCRIGIENFIITNFSGNGLYVSADAGLSHGNANNWYARQGRIMANGGCGVKVEGGDVNASNVKNVDANYNGRDGFFNDSFLCVKYEACHTSDNGYSDRFPSMAYNGVDAIYCVREGQEALAKTTAPATGSVWFKVADWRYGIDYFDHADDSNWGRRTWVSGTRDYYFAAAYYNKGPVGQATFDTCYSEGRAPPAHFNSQSIVIGGTWGSPSGQEPLGTGALIYGSLGAFLANKPIISKYQNPTVDKQVLAGVGGNGSDQIITASQTGAAKTFFSGSEYNQRFYLNDVIEARSYADFDVSRVMLGLGSGFTLGRIIMTEGIQHFPQGISTGASGSLGRHITSAGSPPLGYNFAHGDIVINNGSVPANDAVDYWIRKNGNWVVRPAGTVITTAGVLGVTTGDSTISAYDSGAGVFSSVASLTTNMAAVDISYPGETIAQQRFRFDSIKNYANLLYVVVQVGLNNLTPSTTASAVITELQAYITDIRSKVPAGCKIVIGQMTPAQLRWTTLYGAGPGAVVQTLWTNVNTAIGGGGATPITGVDGRVTSYVAAIASPAGTLNPTYNPNGDGIHENNTARGTIATAWRTALIAAGVPGI